jgi:Ni,Fe-hydrogenase III large subunit
MDRMPGERRCNFYVARVDNLQRVQERLSPVFESLALAQDAHRQLRVKHSAIVEETLTRFIHGAA